DWQPLRRASGGHGTVLCPNVADECVVDHNGEIARHLQLVAAADGDALNTCDRGLADLAQTIVHVLERADPLPVQARIVEELGAPGLQVGADTKRASLARDDDDADV